MQIVIDAEFKRLIPALLPEEFKQLEANILQDGGIKEPLSIWKTKDGNILLDGHNRFKISEKNNLKFSTTEIELADRDHAKLWIEEHQAGRRNLSESQLDDIRASIAERRQDIRRKEAAAKAGSNKPLSNQQDNVSRTGVADVKSKETRTLREVAKETKRPQRELERSLKIRKEAPEVAAMVRSGDITKPEAMKIIALPAQARQIAVEAVKEDIKKGADIDVRAAIREAKKEDYNATVAATKPKELEGTYRILYADPPWKYVGLNQADEYGHAERHYDCLDDEQLKKFKIGKRLVRDIADKNAVLFLWVTSPLLQRCFTIIESWGFEYKASFVWDKVKHNMGHYNSVRHEFLLICTRGSCKPDVPKLVDSVQSIERSNKHSEKPEEFRKIIESLYDHGRKLELFRRGDAPDGWDIAGNEAE